MTKAKIELANLGWPAGASRWLLAISCSLAAGTPSHGTIAPSITPLDIDSGTEGSGICTGVAPSAASMREFRRVAARIFRPFRSSSVRTPLALDRWNDEPSLVCRKIGRTPWYSSSAFFCTKLQ